MQFWKQHQRIIICFLLLIGSCTAVCAAITDAAAVQTGAWGLHFQEEGQAPTGSASPTALAQYHASFLGDPKEPVLYLTFDAGYENGYTAQILDVLKAHGVPAAFFLVGNYLEKEPALVQRMVAEGHTVGNHTWSHPDMSAISDKAAFSKELEKVETKFHEITGQALPKFYRPPQGNYSEDNLKLAKELGYKTVFWSLAYADWDNHNQPSAEEAFSKLIPRVHNGAVVLLHSTSKTNAAILDELLTRWEDLGYRFASLEHLFASQP